MDYYLLTLIKLFIVFGAFMTTLAYLQWIERKVLGHIQLRLGPQRVGPHGLLQPMADVIKLTLKEGFIPKNVNTFFYLLAPILAVGLALVSIAVMPFGPTIEMFGVKTNIGVADINIGILFVLAISSVGVYGLALAGWASNNKYSLMGGLRSSAQMVSYELPMAIALATPLLMLNSVSLREIAEKQGGAVLGFLPNWVIFQTPGLTLVAFLIFLIAAFAETNRVPFDLPEAENELVAGFHTEYSSLGFASFFMAEYANMVTVTCVATTIYLGAWHSPFPWSSTLTLLFPSFVFLFGALVLFYHGILQPARKWDRYTMPFFGMVFLGLAGLFQIPLVQPILNPVFWFVAKAGAVMFLYIWVRGTLPRFRYDQLMRFTWTFLFPVAVGCLVLTGLWVVAVG